MPTLIDRYRRHRARRSRGQSLTEFALVLPILLLVVLMALDFGRVYLGYVNLMQSARLAANFAALNPTANWASTTDPIRLRYVDLITRDAATTNCDPSPIAMPSFPDGTQLGQRAVATLTCDFDLLTPFIGAVISNPVNVEAEAVFPIRTGSINGVPVGTALPTGSPPGPTPTPSPTPPVGPIAAFCGTPQTPGATGGCGTPDNILGIVTNGSQVLAVSFQDQSTGGATTWSWNFGDGSPLDTTASPNHNYNGIGTYTVTLTVGDGTNNDAETKTAYVTIGCRVPDLQGATQAQARTLWTQAGFTLANLSFIPNNNWQGGWTVATQNPWSGGIVNPQPGGCNITETAKK
jgi:hypothetical protein